MFIHPSRGLNGGGSGGGFGVAGVLEWRGVTGLGVAGVSKPGGVWV